MSIATIEAVRALDGRIFAMLSGDELEVLGFYRVQGRKFDVAVTIENLADADELKRAASPVQADEIQRRRNSRISVRVGPAAARAWAARARANYSET